MEALGAQPEGRAGSEPQPCTHTMQQGKEAGRKQGCLAGLRAFSSFTSQCVTRATTTTELVSAALCLALTLVKQWLGSSCCCSAQHGPLGAAQIHNRKEKKKITGRKRTSLERKSSGKHKYLCSE